MSLHYARNGYRFSADAHSLTIIPGQEPLTLQRPELEQLGLAIRDDYQVPHSDRQESGQSLAGILAALTEALGRCEGQKLAPTRRNIRNAMALIDGMDRATAEGILARNESSRT